MRKGQMALCCLVVILFPVSCAPEPINEQGTEKENNPKSIELPTENIRGKYEINDRFVLVETQIKGNAPQFDLYDLEEGAVYNLPTMPEHVVLEEIVNGNYYIFRTTGMNSESVDRTVPETIKCFRVYDSDSAFESVREPVQFNLTESVIVGTEHKANAEHADLEFGIRDICIGFSSKEDSEKSMDGFPLLPYMEIGGSGEERVLFVNIERKSITTEVFGEETLSLNPYVKDYTLEETENGIKILVFLEDNVEGYFVDDNQWENPSIKLMFE